MDNPTCHTSYGNTIANPYDADRHESPLSVDKMQVALKQAYDANRIELLNNAVKSGNVAVIQQRLGGLVGWPMKVVNENGRKHTGMTSRQRGGLVVINAKGKAWTFGWDEVVDIKWNRLPDGNYRPCLTIDRE